VIPAVLLMQSHNSQPDVSENEHAKQFSNWV